MYEWLRFKHPFTRTISSPSSSGKSTFCINLLRNLDTLCTEREFKWGIIWCYSEKTAVPHKQLSALNKNVQYHKGVPGNNNFPNAQVEPCLIILDDLLTEVYSEDVCVLFARGSHHRNISVILNTQNLFHQGRNCRDISLNAKYLVLFKNVRDKRQFSYLANQVLPEDSSGSFKAYLDATKRLHGYLLLDLTHESEDRYRFRTKVLPREHPPIIYVALDDEESKGKLSHSTSVKNRKAVVEESYNFGRRQRID